MVGGAGEDADEISHPGRRRFNANNLIGFPRLNLINAKFSPRVGHGAANTSDRHFLHSRVGFDQFVGAEHMAQKKKPSLRTYFPPAFAVQDTWSILVGSILPANAKMT